MNAPNMTQVNIIKELANQYAAIPEQFLTQGLGRQPEIDEFAAFIETSVAKIFGGMYGILREVKSPQEAEAWVKKTLGVTSAFVRMEGSDAILKFDVSIKEVPNTLHKKQAVADPLQSQASKEPSMPQASSAPAAAQTPPASCNCAVDSNGKCPKCVGMLATYFQGVVQPFMKIAEMAQSISGMCNTCRSMYTDYSLSTILPGLLGMVQAGNLQERQIAFQQILVALYSIAASLGARELPITDKVYATVMASQSKA